MSATATMPTPDQIKAYAESLPDIYRQVLTALHTADPDRRYGDGVVSYQLWQQLTAVRSQYARRDYEFALQELEQSGFVRHLEDIPFWQVTELGEELLAAVTGRRAKKVVVPALPKPNW
jgi:hypothetical protein